MLDERFDVGFDGELSRTAHRPERVEGQEMEAGTLLILACAVGWSFARMWKPGMNDIPHSGCLPLEEYLLERTLPLEADETFTVCGRPWLTLK